MKKVRFETPDNLYTRMDESECQSPRPFMERRSTNAPDIYEPQKIIYSSDPVHRFECSDSSPYPLAKKTFLSIAGREPNQFPLSELNLSMLDSHEPRPCISSFKPIETRSELKDRMHQPNILASIENSVTPPNVLSRDDSFFIRRSNLDKYLENPLEKQLNGLSLDKENEPLHKKAGMITVAPSLPARLSQQVHSQNVANNDCMCHHCKVRTPYHIPQPVITTPSYQTIIPPKHSCLCCCQPQINTCFQCKPQVQKIQTSCNCSEATNSPRNAVDKKSWAIERYEQGQMEQCLEVQKQTNIVKEKREPTISDLVKIIKLQNEQLQLLQEKVDKFISTGNVQPIQIPVQNYVTEHVALQTIDTEHKISIGVMTSFEMVRTSTVINKEILTQTTDNAQIQCNRSQISIKEVVSKPVHLNFLDGITPVGKTSHHMEVGSNKESQGNTEVQSNIPQLANEEKTLNEMSLYNVQVDNATTPLMSPEQSLYLDVRDYSDSDTSDDQSNVGWTYYNKVMTHVNGMLQDSDMPSSASALYRNTRQQCMQMQIDKTNYSVTKRVKFGDDPLGVHQPHIYAASSDTSLKMNQLAAKYLKAAAPPRVTKPTPNPLDMSFATRNYMERHKILQGTATSRSPANGEIPRFLDITALKQQPKLL